MEMEIVAEVPGFMQVFSDGSVKRFPLPISDASFEFSDGFKSKDVVINPSKPITARIFFPDAQDSYALLPVLVYFHGGAFCIASTTWTGYHRFLGDLCKKAQCIVVSIDYRLAPENRLPAAYEDCLDSIRWLSRSADFEPWLERADLSRVFLSGDASGGNIIHNAMVEMKRSGPPSNVKIRGLLAMDPYFGSERRTEREMADGAAAMVKLSDMLWSLSLPMGADRDHLACNFEMAERSQAEIEWSWFPPIVVFAAGFDLRKERSVMYVEFLKRKGVEQVELVVAEGEYHGYHLFHPQSESTRLLQHKMIEFVNRF